MRFHAPILVAMVALGTPRWDEPLEAQRPARLASQRFDSMALDETEPLLDRPARLVVRDATLSRALNELRQSSGVPIAFSDNLLPPNERRSCDCRYLTVAKALDRLIEGTGLRYVVIETQVLIEPIPRPRVRNEASPSPRIRLVGLGQPDGRGLADLVARMLEPEQPRYINGVVTDERGRLIAGANVTIAASRSQAATDAAGRFRLETPSGEVTLRITAIGYRPMTRVIGPAEVEVRLILAEAPVSLDELVVTGTPGATEKRAIGNAVSTIAAAKVAEVAPVSTVAQLISGRAAGALVQLANGTIGSGARIKLRGSASLGLSDQPLIYVDGVRVDNKVASGPFSDGFVGNISRLNDFNPADIESVEIIKGPAAATLYGTEAANGVIQIITKRGSRGAGSQWQLGVRQGGIWFQNPGDRFDPVYGTDPSGRPFAVNPYQLALDQGERPFRTGHLQGYEGSVSGGGNKMQYYLGGGFDKDQGIEPTNGVRLYRGRLNLGLALTEKVDINTNLAYVSNSATMPAGGFFGGSLFALTLVRPDLIPTPRRGWIFGSPREWQRAFEFSQGVNRLTTSVQLIHRPLSWLNHRLNFGLDQLTEDNAAIWEKMPPDLILAFGSGLGAGAQFFDSRRATNTTIDWGASATAALTKTLQSVTSVGLQYFRKTEKTFIGFGQGFPAAGLSSLSAAQIRDAGETFLANATVGLYLQEQLGINGRLFFTGAIRGDDNSAFGKNFKAAYYPKASATWVISEEPFWKAGLLSTLRLRAAYGHSGQQPQAFDALRTFRPVAGGGGVPGITPSSIGNADLKPERGTEIEVGFDAGLFEDRAGLQFTVYRKKTTDAILQRAVRPSLGFPGSQFVNVGEVTNRGVEVLLNGRAVEGRAIDVDLVVNVGANDNKVVQVGNAQGFVPVAFTGFPVSNQRHQDGYPIAAYFDKRVVSATFDPQTKLAENILCDNGTGGAVDCAIAPAVYLGRSVPTWFGSVSPTVTVFDRLRLYALVDFQAGYKRVDSEHVNSCSLGTCPEIFFPAQFDLNKVAAQQIFLYTDFALENAGFARLRELSASYTLPESWVRPVGGKSALLTVIARNLKTWTSFPGLDPEAFIVSEQFSGDNSQAMPQLASIAARFVVTF